MDGRHEQGLVAWANTFSSSFPEGAAPAASLAHFTNGDALIPIARTILGDNHDDHDSDGQATASGWAGVISYLHSADLIEKDLQVPTEEDSKRDMAVTCLEALLHHTCQDTCAGRATFIRQIMSLDTDVQSVLRHVVAGEEPLDEDGDASSSEAGSPYRDDRDGGASRSFAGSPAAIAAAHLSPGSGASRRRRTSITTSGSSYDSSHSDEEDGLGLESWYSPHPRRSARRKSKVPTGGGTGGRAARVGPRPPRQGRTLDMEEAEEALVGATATSATPLPPPAPPASCPAGWTVTAVEVVDLKAEVSRLKDQLERAAAARAEAVSVVEAQRDAAAERAEELREDLWKARQAAERVTISEEDAVIAVEREVRAEFEKEMAVLKERATEAEERASALESFEEEVLRLRDDVDILRPAEAKLSKLEDTLSKYREKIEELSGLPGQLKREEKAHAEVLDRCLRLETEVTQIPQLRRQVGQYRRSQTDMEVASREQSRELETAREESARLSQEVKDLRESYEAARGEQRRLQERWTARDTEGSDDEWAGGGIGEGGHGFLGAELLGGVFAGQAVVGISEFNPELMEEMARLRLANEQLKAKVDYNTEETILDLERKAGDASRLADKFHDSLASEREVRAAAELSLAEARARIADLESQIVALREEHLATVTRLEGESERREEGLRGEMAAAAGAAAAAAARVEEERSGERAEFREAAAREGERAAAELAAAREAHEKEKGESARKEEEAARELADARLAFESRVAEVEKELEGKLQEERRLAAEELAVARERTAEEEKGRSEEARMKEEAERQLRELAEKFSTGKQEALKAIGRLETNARDQREESALLLQEQMADHEAKMAALSGEFARYRETHTVDDISYNQDVDQWEMSIATKKKMIGDLQGQLRALEKDKRKLEREKTFYWGRAEELRMSAAAGGRADPSRDADHLQLVEQTRELIEENRELRQRAQDNSDGGGAMSTRSGGRWGSSGVAAMRAEHEAEMTALKEEKQDLLLKYHATSAKLNEEQQRCAELNGEVEEARAQFVSLQLVNKRQEKKLQDSIATSARMTSPATGSSSSIDDDPSTQKENRAAVRRPSSSSSSARHLRSRAGRGGSKDKGVELSLKGVEGGGSTKGGYDGSGAAGAAPGGRGPLRGLGNARLQEEALVLDNKKAVLDKEAGVLARVGRVDEDTPPECVQS
ncbi:unnamed protein product [Ectocarpus sp. CCAP 1310/34]|nr:unnamed protein product [Ectocarpus sp. CCAP 1310/34]